MNRLNTQTIDKASERGYLVAAPEAAAERAAWMRIVRDEARPFVAIMAHTVVYETGHVPHLTAQARDLVRRAASRHSKSRVIDRAPTCCAVQHLPKWEARALASDLANLGAQGSRNESGGVY
jgi:hypothetical protein